MSPLISHAAALLGAPLSNAAALHGGDLNEVLQAQLPGGQSVVVKGGPNPPAEAQMLHAIKASGAPAPDVVAVSDEVLVLEPCAADGSLSTSWASLGQAIKTLHASHGERYGWPHSYAFGHVSIANETHEPWPQFWAQRRLLCHRGHVPADLIARIEALCGRLEAILPAKPKPSLLHGDLWNGNILCAHGAVTGLIDPACYYGHGEVDLAMLCLFSQPDAAFWEHYGVSPNTEDFHARQAIYQLWPALVHVRLFGPGYHGLVDRCLTAVGA